jgi:hypothetical protein
MRGTTESHYEVGQVLHYSIARDVFRCRTRKMTQLELVYGTKTQTMVNSSAANFLALASKLAQTHALQKHDLSLVKRWWAQYLPH